MARPALDSVQSPQYNPANPAGIYTPPVNTSGIFNPNEQLPLASSPAPDEPKSNLPFDRRLIRKSLFPGQPNVTSGSITTDTPLRAADPSADPGGPYYCFFLFNPAEIDASYGFDTSLNSMLPAAYTNPATQEVAGGGVLTQTISFNLLFDRTYEVWNGHLADLQGTSKLPSYSMVGFGQNAVTAPKNGGPYHFGVLWDVWALERLCGIYRQADGIHPNGPPVPKIVHVQMGGANVANTISASQENLFQKSTLTTLNEPSTPSYLDFYGWFTSFNVQYTRFDANMTPTRCTTSLGFQLTYVNPSINPNTNATSPSPSGQ